MTKEEALYKVKGYLTDIILAEDYSEVEEIIKALEQEPCEDAISRRAVLDLDIRKLMLTTAKPIEIIEQKIKQLPPVTPQPQKIGHWMKHEHNGIGYIECSECLCWFLESELLRNSYCPNCGAKNRK